jgi:hypothetical protein
MTGTVHRPLELPRPVGFATGYFTGLLLSGGHRDKMWQDKQAGREDGCYRYRPGC